MCNWADWLLPFIFGGLLGAILALGYSLLEFKLQRRSVLHEYNLAKKSELDDLI